jgi:ABC-2 type transport system permease protein
LLWRVAFSTALQLAALGVLIGMGAVPVELGPRLGLAALAFFLLVAANAGIGFIGASLFFLLEVKSGQDPVTWAYRYLVMLATGLYVPLTLLPGWLRAMGTALPQTYAFAAVRSLVLTGAGWSDPNVGAKIVGLAVAAILLLGLGVLMVNLALRRAERQSGLGVVV